MSRFGSGLGFISMEGRLIRDPELRYTPAGKAVAGGTIVTKDRKRGQNGQWEDANPSFVDFTVWGQLAERLTESCEKGDNVMLNGRLIQENWENQQGEKRSKLKVMVDEIGVSLQFAAYRKVEQEQRQSGEPQQVEADPWATPQPAQQEMYPSEPPF